MEPRDLEGSGPAPRAASRRRGASLVKILLAVVGVVASTILIASAFFQIRVRGPGPLLTPRFSLENFFADLPGHLGWLLVFVLLSAAIVPLRALQWQTTLPKPVPFSERYHLVAIGAFTHNVLPGKLGDIIRSFLMARTQRLPFIQALGSVAVCKLLEFAALMLLVAVSFLGPFAQIIGRFSQGVRIAVPVCVGLVILVIALAHYAAPLGNWMDRQHRFPKARTFLHNVGEGLGTARSVRGLFRALLFSIGPVLASSLAYGLAIEGLGVRGGLWAGPVILGAIALGQLVPGLPVGMGVYYFVTSWTARELGASAEDAAAFSVLTHLATVLTMIAVGGISVWKRKLKWSELRKGAHAASSATHHLEDVPDAEPTRA